ncbi:MAG: DUF488 family protein [Vulcanimicrobiaceae bacterium]
MTLFTIGFTQTTARGFFERITAAGVRIVLDTRIHRDSQLSGFAKAVDLEYFLAELSGSAYRAEPIFAPTAELLKQYRDKQLSWKEYEERYRLLLYERHPKDVLKPEDLDGACLLCSEHKPDLCHRRLAAEYLCDAYRGASPFEIVHL